MATPRALWVGSIFACALAGWGQAAAQDAPTKGATPPATANASAPKPAPPALVVGTIDMDAVFKGYEKVKASSEEFKAAAMAKNEELVKLAADIQTEIDKFKKLTPNSPDSKAAEIKITEMKAKHEAQRQQAERDFSIREAESMAALYKEVQQMTAAIAKHRGVTMVIKVSNEPPNGKQPDTVIAAMSRAVVYSDNRYDLTRDVVYNLNHYYKAGAKVEATAGTNAGQGQK